MQDYYKQRYKCYKRSLLVSSLTVLFMNKKQTRKAVYYDEQRIKKSSKRGFIPSPSVGRLFDPPTPGVSRESGGGGASCITALTPLALHHHVPGDTCDLTISHLTWDPCPERQYETVW